MAFFTISRPITNINSIFATVIVGVVINELALVFTLDIRNLESGDTSCKVDDIFLYSIATVGSQNCGKELKTMVLRLTLEITVPKAFTHVYLLYMIVM